MKIEQDIIKAPSFWASYLINADCSGMEDSEIADCDQWVKDLDDWRIACPDGESFFGSFYFPATKKTLGCDLLEYPIYREVKDS